MWIPLLFTVLSPAQAGSTPTPACERQDPDLMVAPYAVTGSSVLRLRKMIWEFGPRDTSGYHHPVLVTGHARVLSCQEQPDGLELDVMTLLTLNYPVLDQTPDVPRVVSVFARGWFPAFERVGKRQLREASEWLACLPSYAARQESCAEAQRVVEQADTEMGWGMDASLYPVLDEYLRRYGGPPETAQSCDTAGLSPEWSAVVGLWDWEGTNFRLRICSRDGALDLDVWDLDSRERFLIERVEPDTTGLWLTIRMPPPSSTPRIPGGGTWYRWHLAPSAQGVRLSVESDPTPVPLTARR